jgi:ribose transport system permease protein
VKSFLLKRLPQLGLLLVILILTGYLSSRQSLFFTLGTVSLIFKYYSPMAMLALGMTFIILTGGIDLSVGFVMMLLMFVMASLARDHPDLSPLAMLCAGLGASLLIGGFLGATVAFGRIPAFIVSLATMVGAYGVTMLISHNQSISKLPRPLLWLGGTEFKLFGETFPIMLPAVFLAYGGAALLLNKTRFGRYLYALGSNREATRLSGVSVPRIEMAAYVLSGLCVWMAAWMQMGINRTADPKIALSDSLELNAIAIVVIGGTSLAGGRGGVFGTALGATLLSLIFYGLPLVGINEPSYKKIIQAGIILLGAVFDTLQRRYGKAKE